MAENFPTISCVTVSKDRLVQLKSAIDYFCAQTYPEKELLIISDGSNWYQEAVNRYLLQLKRTDIRLIRVPPQLPSCTLGYLRNISLAEAKGELVCQWDDDDLYHPERLQAQFETLLREKAMACCMSDQLQYFYDSRLLFWCDWKKYESGPLGQLIPGTILFYKDKNLSYISSGEDARRGEDSAFLENIFLTAPVATLSGKGHLYIYTYHNSNTFSEARHRLITQKYGLPAAELWNREKAIRQVMDVYGLPSPVRITGREQQTVFTWM